jgi:hypothetical protein
MHLLEAWKFKLFKAVTCGLLKDVIKEHVSECFHLVLRNLVSKLLWKVVSMRVLCNMLGVNHVGTSMLLLHC